MQYMVSIHFSRVLSCVPICRHMHAPTIDSYIKKLMFIRFAITRIHHFNTYSKAWLIAMCRIFKWLEEEIVKRRHGNKTRTV